MREILMRVSIGELCEQEDIEQQTLIELVEHGVAAPMAGLEPPDWVFDTTSVFWLKRAVRLKRDLDIDWLAVSMVIELQRRNERLERQLEHYRQRVERLQ